MHGCTWTNMVEKEKFQLEYDAVIWSGHACGKIHLSFPGELGDSLYHILEILDG